MPASPESPPTTAGCHGLPPEAERRASLQKATRIRRDASQAQHKAADPALSVFVNANAGSGKTYLLVNRVIRLLLDGARPENILCITYTRAAASEMRSRLFERLAEWINLDDADLLQHIRQQLDHKAFSAEQLRRARRLFAMALETPGGLRVQTIHAFCERLLQAFPVEAGLPPGFEVLDEADTRALLDEARTRLLNGDDDQARDDLALLATHLDEQSLHHKVAALLRHRRLLARMNADAGFAERVEQALRQLLGIAEDTPTDPEQWQAMWAQVLHEAPLQEWITRLAPVIDTDGKKTDRETLAALRQMQTALHEGDSRRAWQASRQRLLINTGAPRRQLFTKAVTTAMPDITEQILALRQHCVQHLDGILARRALRANMALLHVGRRILALYEQAKARLGKFDYDDLVLRTLQLLQGPEGPWVLYRLDARIDHLLLDEAQDTSPEQWEILEALTEEFTAGEGIERPVRRTVFAVGDVKQSIYSFQGAAPEAFRRMREIFGQRFRQARLPFDEVPLKVSFRTVQPVLDMVDKVLEQEDFRFGEPHENVQRHYSARPHVPGFVELWPLEEADADTPSSDDEHDDDAMRRALEKLWTPPQSLSAGLHPRLKLARRIAATIRRWLDEGEALPPDEEQARRIAARTGQPPDAGPRPIRPRDILILVRNRTTLMDAIVSALKQQGIPVAGADRLKVTDHIAVQDMLALARFLLLPADDLSLATVLKSPLLARDDGDPFDDDDLLRLRGELFDFARPLQDIAAVHAERPLWHQLQAAAGAGAPVREALQRLRRWRRMAGHLPPYELFAHILWRDGGLRQFMARLGEEVTEPLEALLDLAVHFEREHAASLAAFVEWLQAEAPEIGRQQEGDADLPPDAPGVVRVMTVHGAKGLEAPVVFLADTTSVPGERHMHIITAPLPDDPHGAELPVWPMRGSDRPARLNELVLRHQQEQEEEYNRLLYVAMTRAADRLYVCGVRDRRARRENDGNETNANANLRSWYDRIAEAMQELGQPVTLPDGRSGWRYPADTPHCRRPATAAHGEEPLPPWVGQPAPAEPAPAAWLSPSRLPAPGRDEAPSAATPGTPAEPVLSPLSLARRRRQPQTDPFRRGVLIHRLLQYLPDVPLQQRSARAIEWLTQPARGLTPQQARTLWQEVEQVLQAPHMAALFGPQSRAEVPFATRLPGGDGRELLVSGQIDRLAVLDGEVIVADFKTARPVPQGPEQVPESYVRQLALYCHAARQLWPERSVRGVLIYTAGPTLLELPGEVLDAALREFGHGT